MLSDVSLNSVFVLVLLTIMTVASANARFLPEAPPVTRGIVTVVDLRDAAIEEKLTATTLQGLVNREKSSLYLLLASWDSFWLKQMECDGCIDVKETISLKEALERNNHRIKVVIHYDPLIPATINIATMMAAIKDGIVVSPNTEVGGIDSKNVISLQGRWQTSAAAYEWALDKLLPKMNQQVLACYHPTACSHHLRDYLVSQKVFHFWIASAQAPGITKSMHRQEMAVFRKIMETTPPNIPVLGFWYSGVDPGLDEYTGVGLAGEYGKITVVSDWASNFSFLGGCDTALSASIEGYAKKIASASPPPLEPDKIYICFDIVESGDAPSYVQSRQHEVWQDSKRGAVPINWSLGPAILDLAPTVAKYYYDNATPNDYLYMAISGAGYCHPFRELFHKTTDSERNWAAYIETTSRYLERMRCSVVGVYTDAWKDYDHKSANTVLTRFVTGVDGLDACVMGMGRDNGIEVDKANYYIEKEDKVLISHIMTRWPTDYAEKTKEENIQWLLEDIETYAPQSRPGFMHVMALSWAYTPSDILTVLERIGEKYCAVTIPQFLRLYKQSNAER